MKHRDPALSLITVGAGRGFVATTRTVQLLQMPQTGEWRSLSRAQSLIITAAHCLPRFPPCHGASYVEERTYPNLIGPLDESPTITAECLFADPIADIAVLCNPDGQALYDECCAYETLIDATPSLRMRDPRENVSRAWLLSLDQRWIGCDVRHNGAAWHISNASKPGIQAGMSGSPIFNQDRTAAIGVVCLSDERRPGAYSSEGGPNPRLALDLPAWIAPRAAPITVPAYKLEALEGVAKRIATI